MLAFGALTNILEDLRDLVLQKSLFLQQGERQAVKHIAVFHKNLESLIMSFFQKFTHLNIDLVGGLVRVVTCRRRIAAHERFGVVAAKLYRTQQGAHTVVGYHFARGIARLLNIIRSTRRRIVEYDFLSCAATHRIGHLVQQLVARGRVLIVLRHYHRVTQCTATRQNRNLGNRCGVAQGGSHERVTALMVRGYLTLVLTHDARSTLRTRHHAVDSLIDSTVINHVAVIAGGQQGCLVHHVRQVCTRETGCTLSDLPQIDATVDRLTGGMHLKDALAALHIGRIHTDLAVETTRAQQGGVEHIRAVGRGNHDHVGVAVEAVHFNKQLVKGLLTLVVTAAHADAATATDRIDLVHEDDRGGVRLCFLEQITHAGCAHTHEHLNKVGTGNRVERRASLARNSFREQGLTGTGRAIQQHALGDFSA